MIISIPDSNLELREMTESEYSIYVEQVISADEIFDQYGLEPTGWLVDAIREMNPRVIYYTIFDKKLDQMVGYIGITPENNNIEYYVFKEFRNRGIGTMAAKSFCGAYIDGQITGKPMNEVFAETIYENAASRKLLEKAGFLKTAFGVRWDTVSHSGIDLAAYVFNGEGAA